MALPLRHRVQDSRSSKDANISVSGADPNSGNGGIATMKRRAHPDGGKRSISTVLNSRLELIFGQHDFTMLSLGPGPGSASRSSMSLSCT